MFFSQAISQSRYLLATTIGIFFSHAALADTAGRVNFVAGEVTATSPDNKQRLLYKGDLVNSGDKLETGSKGRIQVRMTDGGFLALRPNSVFQIEKYNFSRETPEQSSLAFKFLKGGMRTISGAIGKVNRASYQFSTPMATIGIRGTDYAGTLNNEVLTVTVNHGQINLANEFGSVDIPEGQTYQAQMGQAPVPSSATIEQDNFETEEEVKPKPEARTTLSSVTNQALTGATAAAGAGAGAAAAEEVARPRLENYGSYNQFLQAMYSFKKFEEEKNTPKMSVKGAPAGATSPELGDLGQTLPAGGTGDVTEGGESLDNQQAAQAGAAGLALLGLNQNNKSGSGSSLNQALARSTFNDFPLKAADGSALRQSSISINSGLNSPLTFIDEDQVLRFSINAAAYSFSSTQLDRLEQSYAQLVRRLITTALIGQETDIYLDERQFRTVQITVEGRED